MKMVRLSAPRTGRFYPPGNIPGTHFCYRLSRPQGHSAAGRIMSMKNCNDTIGNRTRDLLACMAVPQPTAPSRAPNRFSAGGKIHRKYTGICGIEQPGNVEQIHLRGVSCSALIRIDPEKEMAYWHMKLCTGMDTNAVTNYTILNFVP